ncbi:MAG: gliding motility lipoprotein GldH [Flavobacteriales bacterium]|nr:gliding motility lipoprotein GldH [Flavobacteriales bacterium]
MAKRNLNKLGLFVALLLFASCDRSKVFDVYHGIDSGGWNSDEALDFEVEITSQEGRLFNYLIGLRNNNDYLYANIFFFVDVESPNGELQRDTLQYLLAEPGGKWLGSGVGEIKFNLFKFKEGQAMQSGVYKFSIAHGMRDDLLLGVEDVGLRIEESN